MIIFLNLLQLWNYVGQNNEIYNTGQLLDLLINGYLEISKIKSIHKIP